MKQEFITCGLLVLLSGWSPVLTAPKYRAKIAKAVDQLPHAERVKDVDPDFLKIEGMVQGEGK